MLESIARDEDNSVVVINGKTLENTQYLAKILQEKAGGNIFCIEPHQPYPRDYRPLRKQAKEEQRKNFRPTLAGQTANMSEYDTVFIGYPNWWGRHTDDPVHIP